MSLTSTQQLAEALGILLAIVTLAIFAMKHMNGLSVGHTH